MITTKNVREKCLETYNLLRQNHKKDYQLNIDEISNEVMADLVNSDLERMEEIMKLDVVTYQHCLNVATLTKAIAQQFGVREDKLDEVFLAGLFHDIGKIFNGKYNEAIQFNNSESYDNFKAEHVIINEIIAELKRQEGKELAWNIENSMVCHHDRKSDCLNGGYPHRKFVPGIVCQYLQVADTYDAMAHRGVYQRYYSDSEIIDYLEDASQRGLYNLYVIEALKKVLQKPRRKSFFDCLKSKISPILSFFIR